MKRYGLIFRCLASRAVHLETLNTMETDSFISALRRFINRRGKVRQLRSDQGTNFVGARNELADALQELNRDRVKGFSCQRNVIGLTLTLTFRGIPHGRFLRKTHQNYLLIIYINK